MTLDVTGHGKVRIDARVKGSIGRFLNHSHEPNCEYLEVVYGGQFRIGIVSIKAINQGEELTCNYGDGYEFQRCYCGAASCPGFMGSNDKMAGEERRDFRDEALKLYAIKSEAKINLTRAENYGSLFEKVRDLVVPKIV